MQPIVEVGQRFKFTVLMDDALTERQGVVTRVLSNREEGLGLDVDLSPDTVEQTARRDGKIVAVLRLTVAPDGKTIHATYENKEDNITTRSEMRKQDPERGKSR